MNLLTNSKGEAILQGTAEWHFARMNRFSASKIDKIIPGTTKASKDAFKNYVTEKAYGSFQEVPIVKPQFNAIKRGQMLESEARLEFLRQYGIIPETMPIVEANELFNVGKCYLDEHCPIHLISPDGWNENDNFGTEFKVAEEVAKYSRFCRDVTDAASLKEFDKQYYWQVMDSIMCSGANYWWFAYYLPEMKRGYDIKAVKIYPVEEDIKLLRKSLVDATELYKQIYSQIEQTFKKSVQQPIFFVKTLA